MVLTQTKMERSPKFFLNIIMKYLLSISAVSAILKAREVSLKISKTYMTISGSWSTKPSRSSKLISRRHLCSYLAVRSVAYWQQTCQSGQLRAVCSPVLPPLLHITVAGLTNSTTVETWLHSSIQFIHNILLQVNSKQKTLNGWRSGVSFTKIRLAWAPLEPGPVCYGLKSKKRPSRIS